MKEYIGHESQISGIEEYRLTGGKGDGLRLIRLENGKGLDMTVCLDRGTDIYRLKYKGMNTGYFSPCGYVSPAYYDSLGTNWLNSFTAGFLTTCGLQSVGNPCVDEGEACPMHGTISNIPAERVTTEVTEESLTLKSCMKDEVIFAGKYRMDREIKMSLTENKFTIFDSVTNTGDKKQPLQILYHFNIGFPLLDEDSVLNIPAAKVLPRNEHAAKDLKNCLKMEKPQKGYIERCYYHEGVEDGTVTIFQPKTNVLMRMKYDQKMLDCFTEWKMMGYRDYVLGLECANCFPDGRLEMRNKGILKFMEPDEVFKYKVEIEFEG